MKIIRNLIQYMGKKHAQRFAKLVDRQTDPQLYNAIMRKIDNKLNLFTTSGSAQLNPELEAMQDMLFEGLGLGGLDNIFDAVRYGRYALKGAKYKIMPYLVEYRQALTTNLPPLRGRGFIFDFRKTDVSEQEVLNTMKNIFLPK